MAIEYLHTEVGIVHRDLKPENLLLNRNYEIKIADFGLSARNSRGGKETLHYSRVGTRMYQAPEILEGKPYLGTKVDIFSIGVIVFVMVTGALPYYSEASETDPIYQYLCRGDNDKFWSTWRQYRDP